VESIEEHLREQRLRWFGHMERISGNECQKKWKEIIDVDMKVRGLKRCTPPPWAKKEPFLNKIATTHFTQHQQRGTQVESLAISFGNVTIKHNKPNSEISLIKNAMPKLLQT